jgi:NADH-quinone oxidoreductase subunit M
VRVGLLSAVTFLPLLGAIALAVAPRRATHLIRMAGLAVALATLALSVPLYVGFDAEQADYQFVEEARWIPALGVGYHLGIDGISLLLVLLTTFLTPIALAAAWHTIEDRVKEFVMTMLVLEENLPQNLALPAANEVNELNLPEPPTSEPVNTEATPAS